ncbi:MAG: EFR1 family ferrodoxin [Lachnospiraceae bacterium]|nr:EFR1 family ferrodoxin [Ruminococcus sp.]MCM1276193.1 EFR1 family ferrodoxin [Lachnospiraceae bacterium]
MTGLYFSGTGNTEFCVERFLARTGGKAYRIEDKAAVRALSEDGDILFAYPVYYSNMPKLAHDFITENSTLWREKNVFIIATMGLFSGDGAGVSARFLKKFGANVTGGLHIKMPDCIGDVALLKKPPEENARIISEAAAKADRAAEAFLGGKPPRDGLNALCHIAGLFGQRLWFYNKTKNYASAPKIDGAKCVGCGACEKVCPTGNIGVTNGRAISGNKCTMCYRCFSECTQKAVTVIGKRVIVQYKFENYKELI